MEKKKQLKKDSFEKLAYMIKDCPELIPKGNGKMVQADKQQTTLLWYLAGT